MILNFLMVPLAAVPRSVPLIACFVMITTLGGMRAPYRCLVEGSLQLGLKALLRAEPHRLLLYGANYGANAETDAFCRSLQSETAHSCQAVGIIDDDPASRDWCTHMLAVRRTRPSSRVIRES
jgi:FlaA1/EpsC-like NDP-sugar epimerase